MNGTRLGQPDPSRGGRGIDRAIAKLNLEHGLGLIRAHGNLSPQTSDERAIFTLAQFLDRNDKNLLDNVISEFEREARQRRKPFSREGSLSNGAIPAAIPAEGARELRSLLRAKLQNAKDRYFASYNHQPLPLRLSQEVQKFPEMQPFLLSSDVSNLVGSSMDNDLRDLDIPQVGPSGPQQIEASLLHRTETAGSGEDQTMTDAEETFVTPPQSPMKARPTQMADQTPRYASFSGVTRKRESTVSRDEVASRKRSMQCAPDLSLPSLRWQPAELADHLRLYDSFTTNSASDTSYAKMSANTSFKTDTTMTSFGNWSYQGNGREEDSFGRRPESPTGECGAAFLEPNLAIAEQPTFLQPLHGAITLIRPQPKLNGLPSKERLRKQLAEQSPLAQYLDRTPPNVPLRLVYEISRLSLHYKTPATHLYKHVDLVQSIQLEEYECLWSALISFPNKNSSSVPERSQPAAWHAAVDTYDRVAFKAELRFSESPKQPLFNLRIHPLALEDSYRLARHFGFDRFMILNVPSLDTKDLPKHIPGNAEEAREAIIEWLVDSPHYLLGREWRAFYVKPRPTLRQGKAAKDTSGQWRVYLFAVDGYGFHPPGCSPDVHPQLAVEDMVKWFLPFKNNQDSSALKLFARLQLAVSSTTPTIIFHPNQIVRCDDAYSEMAGTRYLDIQRWEQKLAGTAKGLPGRNMSDGCARISQKAARDIAVKLGILDHVPSAFQARIGGAKGLWIVDTLGETLQGEETWIEIADSQLKFKGHNNDNIHPDNHRLTFEVQAKSGPLKAAAMNFQLMPILIDRGVQGSVFIKRLVADLEEKAAHLVSSMQDPLRLRDWNQVNNPVMNFRIQEGCVPQEGGLPKSTSEQINALTESGFDPRSCMFLKDLCRKAIGDYCTRLEERVHIEIGQSTFAFMVPDFLGVLEEDEIHLGFSSTFMDSKSKFYDTMVDNCDVLIARLPAALPSDIHKVKAVFHRELAKLKDVIVFPTKGKFSLAEKLSGGDFDGDRAWVCWDPEIVNNFRNYDMPRQKSPEFYGITKDTTTIEDMLTDKDFFASFLRKGFLFSMRKSLLGMCTSYHEGYCYDLLKNRKSGSMAEPLAVEIGQLLGYLVDTAKNGYTFREQHWETYKTRNRLPKITPKPAYKEQGRVPASRHIIDQLVLVHAKQTRQKTLRDFEQPLKDVPEKEMDLVQVAKTEENAAQGDPDLRAVLVGLKTQLGELHDYWNINNGLRKKNEVTFAAYASQIRAMFLQIQPWSGTLASKPPTSTLVRRWVEESSRPSTSFSTQDSWSLVKASVLYDFRFRGQFPWIACGVELMAIKVGLNGRPPSLTAQMRHHMKLDRKMLERSTKREADRAQIRIDADVYIPELDEDEYMTQDFSEAYETRSQTE